MNRLFFSRAAVALAFTGSTLSAQHTRTAQDLEQGRELYRTACVLCHGLEGNGVPGVDFRQGNFRRGTSDEDLVRIINEGIAGTAMPANHMPAADAEKTVAYLRSMSSRSRNPGNVESGDSLRGKAVYEGKGQCPACHAIDGKGSSIGPDLSEIGGLRSVAEIAQSIVDPDAEVLPPYQSFRGVTRGGVVIAGTTLNEDTFSIQVREPSGRLLGLSKSDLRDYSLRGNSSMPSYRDRLTDVELRDLVMYLASLKGL
jgi:cytochrome c oxidase cbb3-type subunit 3